MNFRYQRHGQLSLQLGYHLSSLGPGSAVGEKGKKRGQIGNKSASEASPLVGWEGGGGYRRGIALQNKRSRGSCSCLRQLGRPCDFRSFAIFL